MDVRPVLQLVFTMYHGTECKFGVKVAPLETQNEWITTQGNTIHGLVEDIYRLSWKSWCGYIFKVIKSPDDDKDSKQLKSQLQLRFNEYNMANQYLTCNNAVCNNSE